MKILGNTPSEDSAEQLGIPFLLKMQDEILLFSPHFIDDTLKTKAERAKDSLISRKYMFLAKIFCIEVYEKKKKKKKKNILKKPNGETSVY